MQDYSSNIFLSQKGCEHVHDISICLLHSFFHVSVFHVFALYWNDLIKLWKRMYWSAKINYIVFIYYNYSCFKMGKWLQQQPDASFYVSIWAVWGGTICEIFNLVPKFFGLADSLMNIETIHVTNWTRTLKAW